VKIRPKRKIVTHLVVINEEDNEDVFPNTNLVATKWKHHKLLTSWPSSDDKSKKT
jgi:hypothetical protein